MHKISMAAIALVLAASGALAQGNLSQQGYGYPPGQLSTRTLSMGGGLAEFDSQSPLNPAALASWGPAGLYIQYDPEFRSVGSDGGDEHTTTPRFPVIAGAFSLGERTTLGLSASTFVDRTWATRFERLDTLRGVEVVSTEQFRSEGAVNDVRLAGSFVIRPSLRVGLGLHAYTGENRLAVERDFRNPDGTTGADSATYAPFEQRSTLSYGGTAISAGAEWRPMRSISVAASARRGGTIKTRVGDEVQSEATIPNRYGAGIRYDGFAGTTIAARVNWEEWSSVRELSLPGLPVSDVLELGVGADVAGPRVAGRSLLLRFGGRWRELPFGVRADPTRELPAANDVRETALTGGFGLPFAGGRALADVGVQRASRSSDTRSDVSEKAWTLSIGLRVRP